VQNSKEIKYRQIVNKYFIISIFSCLISQFGLSAQSILSKKLSLDFENKKIEEILSHLQNTEGICFSYSKNIIRLDQKVTIHAKNTHLDKVLNEIFKETEIMYKFKSGIIILQRKPQNIDKILITGTIKSLIDMEPLEFVGVQLNKAGKGTITDKKGNFSILINKEELQDSLVVSSLGYEKASFPVVGFMRNSEHVVYLKQRIINLKEVEIKASDFKFYSIGNHKIISFGSIYIDTQGQQTALFIKNKKHKNGTISSVSYYLSKKGNTGSPFRVRIYERDSISLKPGRDLLKEVIIAQPNIDGGWFKIDISQFNIEAPEYGFFVGIEGISPNDFTNEVSDFVDITESIDNKVPNTISYGQKLGYSNKNGEDTWHYSLAHTWFQLEEQNYNVMISAEIQTKKHKRSRKDKN